MHKVIALVCVLSFSGFLTAQTTISLGATTGTSNVIPFNLSGATWGESGRYQTAYSSTEMNLSSGGSITEIRVRNLSGSPTTYGNFRLRLAHTTGNPTALSGTFALNYTGTLTTVIGDTGTSSPVAYLPTTITVGSENWVRFPLTTAWQYNGTDGILVDWSFDSMAGAGFSIGSVGTRSRVYAYGTGTNSYQVATGSSSNGAGNWQIQFIVQVGPQLAVATTAGTAQSVYANDTGSGGNGRQVGTFTVAQGAQTGASLTNIQLQAAGTGNDAAAYSEVAIYRESGANTVFDFGTDVLIASHTNFGSDNGSLNFAVTGAEQTFTANQIKSYYIVVKLNGPTPAQPGHTFNYVVQDISVTGTNATKSGVPSSAINGLSISTPTFTFADVSTATATTVYLNSTYNICQTFTIAYPNGPNDKPASVTITGLGSAHEVNDLDSVQLWYDSNDNGTLNTGTDTQLATGTYSADNGTVTLSMAAMAAFQAGQTRRFFVTYDLNLNASNNETFQCYVSAASAAAYGGTVSGLPVPGVSGTAGLVVNSNLLAVTMNGPSAATTVNSNYQGPTGAGTLLLDVTLAATPGAAWTVTSLTFDAAGTGNHNAAYSDVSLYQDDGNGMWDGTPTDTLAAAAGNFVANSVTMTLNNSSFPAGVSRRFFLVGRLNGSAVAGQTFNARLQSGVITPPAGGTVQGLPTGNSTALIIDVAALSVSNGPALATPPVHLAGTTAAYVVSRWRLAATNSDIAVNGLTITTGGTGSWATGVTDVSIWLDDGDGSFNAALDTQLFSAPGSTSIASVFTGLTVSNNDTEDLWVRVSLSNTAGVGAAATPQTFTLGIAAAADVGAGGGAAVLLSTPSPSSVNLGAIDFEVTGITPISDFLAGGAAITLNGSGFMAPLTVTIGGVVCPGTPVISGGTLVTGLAVPPGSGSNRPIVVTSGNLPPQTLSQTFTYSGISVVGASGGGGGGGGGCAAETGTSLAAALAALGLLALARRRRNAADRR